MKKRKIADSAARAIRRHLDKHPETWFTPAQLAYELEREDPPHYLITARVKRVLLALVEDGIAECAPTGFEHYTQPKTKFRRVLRA